jgi:hypothetical protein
MAAELGWDQPMVQAEIARYRQHVGASLASLPLKG